MNWGLDWIGENEMEGIDWEMEVYFYLQRGYCGVPLVGRDIGALLHVWRYPNPQRGSIVGRGDAVGGWRYCNHSPYDFEYHNKDMYGCISTAAWMVQVLEPFFL